MRTCTVCNTGASVTTDSSLHDSVQVMDKHLALLAQRHLETKFVKVRMGPDCFPWHGLMFLWRAHPGMQHGSTVLSSLPRMPCRRFLSMLGCTRACHLTSTCTSSDHNSA